MPQSCSDLGGELIDCDHLVIPSLARTFAPAGRRPRSRRRRSLEHDLFFFDERVGPRRRHRAECTPRAAYMFRGAHRHGYFAAIRRSSRASTAGRFPYIEAGLQPTDQIYRLLCLVGGEEFGARGRDAVGVQSADAHRLRWPARDDFAVFGLTDERYHMHRGSASVPDAIAATIPDQILIDHALTKVVANATDYRSRSRASGGGVEVTVDHVVYALLVHELRDVDPHRRDAHRRAAAGHQEPRLRANAKLMLQALYARIQAVEANVGRRQHQGVGQLQTTWSTCARPGRRAGHAAAAVRRRQPRRRDRRHDSRAQAQIVLAVARHGVPGHRPDVHPELERSASTGRRTRSTRAATRRTSSGSGRSSARKARASATSTSAARHCSEVLPGLHGRLCADERAR